MNRRAKAILGLDGGAGFGVGLAVLAFHEWVAQLHGFAPPLVLLVGAANLAYGSYSGTLAIRAALNRPPSRAAIDVLIAANGLWAIVCAVLIATLHSASAFGLAHVALEGLFVAVLAFAERRWVRPFAR